MKKDLGWLFYIGDYTTQLYGDYNEPLWHIYLRLSQIVCQMYKVDGPLPVVSSNFTHLQDPLKGL